MILDVAGREDGGGERLPICAFRMVIGWSVCFDPLQLPPELPP